MVRGGADALYLHGHRGVAQVPRSVRGDGVPQHRRPPRRVALAGDARAARGERHVDRRHPGHPQRVPRPGADARAGLSVAACQVRGGLEARRRARRHRGHRNRPSRRAARHRRVPRRPQVLDHELPPVHRVEPRPQRARRRPGSLAVRRLELHYARAPRKPGGRRVQRGGRIDARRFDPTPRESRTPLRVHARRPGQTSRGATICAGATLLASVLQVDGARRRRGRGAGPRRNGRARPDAPPPAHLRAAGAGRRRRRARGPRGRPGRGARRRPVPERLLLHDVGAARAGTPRRRGRRALPPRRGRRGAPPPPLRRAAPQGRRRTGVLPGPGPLP